MALSDAGKAALLGDIGFHWGDAYVIDFNGEMFAAHRIGYPEHILMAETTVHLREAIRKDYFAWMAGLRERMST
jgi:hypothetical protein